MASLVKWLLDPNRNPIAKIHKKAVGILKYGLRYDDLDIQVALNRLPKEVVDARNQRLFQTAMQTPFRSYIQEMLALVQRENAERKALGALPLYQRTIR